MGDLVVALRWRPFGVTARPLDFLVALGLTLALVAGNLSPARTTLVRLGIACASALWQSDLVRRLALLVLALTARCKVDVALVISHSVAVARLEVWCGVLKWFRYEAVGVPLPSGEQLLVAHNAAWLAIVLLAD